MIVCPHTGHYIATGIITSRAILDQLPDGLFYTECSHCKIMHSWMARDAFCREPRKLRTNDTLKIV